MEQRRDIFQAIADPTRREILSALIEEPKNLNSLAEQFSISRQGVSLHVKVLEECDMIAISKEGRERYCHIKPEKLLDIIEWLEPFKQLWRDRFDQLDDLLKNKIIVMNKTTFTEDLENNRLIAVRKFDAPIEKVWNAWSNPDILCQWWAPQPYTCKIDSMDFKTGGHWIYNMIGPEGDVHRGRMDFLDIEQHKKLEAEDYFCDEKGEKAGDIPPMQLTVTFETEGASTIVTSITTFTSAEALKQMAEMGMAEGWELACNQLEALLI